ncbi:MAG: phosphoadenylyl-sulfate reductase [Bacteroidetes bacterium]|jgi:phosphoadenosine phosphosulfate reductase|nr:phosphoadenylyl-sulfate reductase [Bacteroidota bacterium]
MKEKVEELNNILKGKSAEEVIHYCINEFKGKIALSSSLGAEDQVLTKMVVDEDPSTRIFTLDTGRLFPETYDLIDRTNKTYNIKLDIFFPDYKQVQQMVKEKGINLFYESKENRKQCCHIRKVEPLKRAFKGLDAWICGLRKDQSVTRFFSQLIEWDDTNELVKINPLIDWSEKDVWNYIHEHQVPYNTLHDHNYPSIGCQPCTRAIKAGEDVRAGRWWWEAPEHKECGLHIGKPAESDAK